MPRKYNKQRKLHVKKGDEVLVIAGNDKGHQRPGSDGSPKKERVLVEGINMRTHHEKPSQENPTGRPAEKRSLHSYFKCDGD
jgi:large subunit ribosomal protein L24